MPRLRLVGMRSSVRGGAVKASSVQVVTDRKGIPLMIRDTEPFHIEVWQSDSGIEFFEQYYLAFSFRGGLFVEITQKLEGAGVGGFSWEVPLDQLGQETLMKLKDSESLERIRAKVKGLVQGMTVNFMITLDQLVEMNSKSSERVRSKFKGIVQRLTENLDSLFFDPVGDWRRICYVCESNAFYECIRCNKDICDQHAAFAETEYGEPLTYCLECFDRVIEK